MEPPAIDEALIRFAAFLALLGVFAAVESRAPRRRRPTPRRARWPGNLGLVVLNTAAVRGLPLASAVGVAALAQERGWGLLPALGPMPVWLAAAVSVVLLDLAIYLQHVLFHAVPGLWRIHRVHHADVDFDVTTGLRFHPVEVLLSLGFKAAATAALGPPVAGVILFEVLLNGGSMFNHANWRLPAGVDRVLRSVVVTPDMHRVHHSVAPAETNSNFGFTLSCWDRLLGTYRAQPAAGHENMTIGIDAFRDPGDLRLHRLLLQPLRPAVPAPPPGPPAITPRLEPSSRMAGSP